VGSGDQKPLFTPKGLTQFAAGFYIGLFLVLNQAGLSYLMWPFVAWSFGILFGASLVYAIAKAVGKRKP
jgi:hypothetical protein